jgi:hypothetical protein
MDIYKELYEYLMSADIEAQNHAFNTPGYVFDLTYEEFCNQIEPKDNVYFACSIPSYGFKGKSHSEETKKKMKAAQVGKKRSEQTKQNIKNGILNSSTHKSKNQFGETNPMYDKKHSEESKAKMSKSRTGKPGTAFGKTWKRSEESKKKMAATCKGRKKLVKPDGSWTWHYPKTLD